MVISHDLGGVFGFHQDFGGGTVYTLDYYDDTAARGLLFIYINKF